MTKIVTRNKLQVTSENRTLLLVTRYSLLLIFLLFAIYCSLSTVVEAKVYIDINSPAFKKLPIAIQEFSGPSGREISDIIKDDLEFTGLFEQIDRNAYVEAPSQPFNPKNWIPIGAEAVVKGSVKEDNDFVLTVSLYDVFEDKEIFKKEYATEKKRIRSLAHGIANDLYQVLAGEKGIFNSRILFIADEEGGRSIHIMDWDGKNDMRTGVKGNLILCPRLSRNGKKLIYSAEKSRQWSIYMVDFTEMTERIVFSSKGTNMAGDFLPESDDFIFSSSKDGNPDLYILNQKEKNVIKLTSSYSIEVSPAVSPDGKHIAFVSDRGGSPQIYVMRRDGSDMRRTTFEGSYNTSPSWSPKGDRIVFSGRRGTRNQIFTVNPDSSGLIQLTTEGNNEDPSFSPDGRFITFTSDRDGMKGIYIMRVNGESQRRMTPKNLRAFSPRWSPN